MIVFFFKENYSNAQIKKSCIKVINIGKSNISLIAERFITIVELTLYRRDFCINIMITWGCMGSVKLQISMREGVMITLAAESIRSSNVIFSATDTATTPTNQKPQGNIYWMYWHIHRQCTFTEIKNTGFMATCMYIKWSAVTIINDLSVFSDILC